MGWDIPQKKTVEVRKDYPKDGALHKTHSLEAKEAEARLKELQEKGK